MKPKPPFPDYNDSEVTSNIIFHDIVWIPSVCLRFVERDNHNATYEFQDTTRILQQRWETHIMNRSGTDNKHGFGPVPKSVTNPNLEQWRDVPVEEE